VSGDQDRDPIRELASNIAQTNGFLKSHVANQEIFNSRVLELLDSHAETLRRQAERLTKTEVNADCVPDLYSQVRSADRRVVKYLGVAVGVIGVFTLLVQFVGMSLGPKLARAVLGGP